MVDWNNLVVVTTEGSVPNSLGWKAGSGVFAAETCMRHIYIGVREDFGEAAKSLLQHKKTKSYEGAAAYRFFLEFYGGLHSHYHSEQQTAGQTRRAWTRYAETQPDEHKKIKPYVDNLFHDGGLVISSILEGHWRRPILVHTAVDMAGLKPASSALVVGGAAELSKDMIKALGYKKPFTPNVVTFTHPNRCELADIAKAIREFSGYETLKAKFEIIPFQRALEDTSATSIQTADAVFVCTPMTPDRNSPLGFINKDLHEAWYLRRLLEPDHKAPLFHLKGDPLQKGGSSGVWLDPIPGLDFVSPETLKEKHNERCRYVQRVVEKSKEAIAYLADQRMQGESVKAIEFDPEKMSLSYRMRRRPLGRPEVAA